HPRPGARLAHHRRLERHHTGAARLRAHGPSRRARVRAREKPSQRARVRAREKRQKGGTDMKKRALIVSTVLLLFLLGAPPLYARLMQGKSLDDIPAGTGYA